MQPISIGIENLGKRRPLGCLDVEYLRAMVACDSNRMRRLRRAGAKIVIPHTELSGPYGVGMHIDYTPVARTEEELRREFRRQDYQKRMALRREVAEIILKDGFWYPEKLRKKRRV